MATPTLVTVEDYLQTPFEGLEPDYFDGEVIERGMPTWNHSGTQQNIQMEAGTFGLLEVGPTRRLIPSTPGLVAIGILSPDDHAWAVDPEPRTLEVHGATGFQQVQRLEIPEHGFILTPEHPEQIFR